MSLAVLVLGRRDAYVRVQLQLIQDVMLWPFPLPLVRHARVRGFGKSRIGVCDKRGAVSWWMTSLCNTT